MNILRPDLNLLVVFEAVATCGSVSEAARRLSLSQPAVSHALNRLRDLVGDRLFVRSRAGLVPTTRAEAMIGPVRAMLANAGEVFAGGVFDPTTSERRFRIGTSAYSNATLLPMLLREFRHHAPGLSLEAVAIAPTTMADLETGQIDCTFWVGSISGPPWRSQQLLEERMIAMVDRTHPLAERAAAGSVELADYLAFPHIMITPAGSAACPIDAALGCLGLSRRVVVWTRSLEANLGALRGTDLIASLQQRMATVVKPEGFVAFEIPLDLSGFAYELVWHSRTDGDPGNVWLRETITRLAAAIDDHGRTRCPEKVPADAT
jgi:DNA-binding transcriptional LysR family regulator